MNLKEGRLEIRDTVAADIESLKDRLLDCDIVEIRELLKMDPREALERAVAISKSCSTLLYDGLPILVFGLVPDGSVSSANVWMLVSKQIDKMRLAFLKMSRRVFADMLEKYPVVYNHINVKHERVIRWLKWCGATILEPQLHEETGEHYSLFVMRRNDYV